MEDNVNKPGTCCSSSLLTEGPLVWQDICLSKLGWGLIRDKEHYISRFCRNTLRLKTVRELHSERTPKLHFFFCLTTWKFPSGHFHGYRRMHRLQNGHSVGLEGSPRWEVAVPRDGDPQALKFHKKINGNKMSTVKCEFKHYFISQNLHALCKLHWDCMNTGIWANTEKWQCYRSKYLKTIFSQNIKCKYMKNCLNSFKCQIE